MSLKQTDSNFGASANYFRPSATLPKVHSSKRTNSSKRSIADARFLQPKGIPMRQFATNRPVMHIKNGKLMCANKKQQGVE